MLNIDTKTVEDDSSELGPAQAWGIALLALAAAGAPHFFLDMPLDFYASANMRGWLGLSIWSPAFLGAVALFFGVDMNARTARPRATNFDLRAVLGITVPLGVLVLLSAWYLNDYSRVGDWEELGLAMLLYAGTFAIGALFWQGFMQRGVMGKWGENPGGGLLRGATVALLGAALWLPFLNHYPLSEVRGTLDGFFVIYLALALLFEVGLSVFACAGVAALMGAAWAWTHQMTFF